MFDNFISLGWFCGTAASMSKYGIRSRSGPFDWYFNDFIGVLACMENNFVDFLDRRNIEIANDSLKEFKDIKYGFHYNHEVNTCFKQDFDYIYNKYMRRIKVFRKMIKQRTCFIRTVRNNDELIYIQNNKSYINKVIRKHNSENEIIYVISGKQISCGELEFPFFKVDSIYDGASRKGLRGLFDSNIELQQFCIRNFDENLRYRNLYYDLQKENHILEPMAAKYELMMHIDKVNLEQILFQKIIIYGAGIVGKYLYQKVKNRCRVLCFVDQYSKENLYEDVPIISLDDFLEREYFDTSIVVTSYSYNEIRTWLIEAGKDNIKSLDEFLYNGGDSAG